MLHTLTRNLKNLLFLFSCVMYGDFCSLKTLLELTNLHKRNRNWNTDKIFTPSPSETMILSIINKKQKENQSDSMIPNESSGSKPSRIRLWPWQSNSGIFFLGFPVFSTTMEHRFSVTTTFKWVHRSVSWQTNVKVKRKKHKLWKTIKKLLN